MRIVLIGGGGHASDILGAFEALSRAEEIIGIVDDREIDQYRFAHRGVRQIGDLSDLEHIDASHYLIALGFSVDRHSVYKRIAHLGREPATVVHPKSDIPRSVPIGKGTVILSGATTSPMASIGEHVYLSHGCLVGHDCRIEAFSTILPGAVVSGDTVLGEACQIGSNATVREKIKIGPRAVVGAGAVVLKDVAADQTVVGNPARVLATARQSLPPGSR